MDIRSGRYVFGYDPGAGPERAGVEAAARPRRPRNPANAFRDLPAPTGPFPFRMDLGGVIGPAAIAEIAAAGKMVFHTVGDTGQKNHGGRRKTRSATTSATRSPSNGTSTHRV